MMMPACVLGDADHPALSRNQEIVAEANSISLYRAARVAFPSPPAPQLPAQRVRHACVNWKAEYVKYVEVQKKE